MRSPRVYAEWEIVGPPEIRSPDLEARYFSPHGDAMMNAELRRFSERPPELAEPPAIDVVEAFLVAVFLRRYVTYCARRSRLAAMSGAARLFAEIRASTA